MCCVNILQFSWISLSPICLFCFYCLCQHWNHIEIQILNHSVNIFLDIFYGFWSQGVWLILNRLICIYIDSYMWYMYVAFFKHLVIQLSHSICWREYTYSNSWTLFICKKLVDHRYGEFYLGTWFKSIC